jgi:hypothetical protein
MILKSDLSESPRCVIYSITFCNKRNEFKRPERNMIYYDYESMEFKAALHCKDFHQFYWPLFYLSLQVHYHYALSL